MRLKWIWPILAVFTFVALCCTTVPERGRDAVSRHVVHYQDAPFEQVWIGAKHALVEIGFSVRKEIKERGLLDAVATQGPYAYNSQHLMNVLVRKEGGRVRVDCLMAHSSRYNHLTRDYIIRFFRELEKQLD
jgi:hypothetical protein